MPTLSANTRLKDVLIGYSEPLLSRDVQIELLIIEYSNT